MGDDPQALIRMIATATHSLKYAPEKQSGLPETGNPVSCCA